MTGQWQKHDMLDAQALEVFEEAYPNVLGVSYKPITPYYTQIVAGTNYIFTVEATVTSPTAQPSIKYLQTFQALPQAGGSVQKATILENLPLKVNPVLDFFLEQSQIGGWQPHTVLSAQALQVFNAAKPHLIGYDYTPVAPYFSQVANGVNYVFSAIGKPVTQHGQPQTLVFIRTCQSNEGNIEPGIIIGGPNVENVA